MKKEQAKNCNRKLKKKPAAKTNINKKKTLVRPGCAWLALKLQKKKNEKNKNKKKNWQGEKKN